MSNYELETAITRMQTLDGLAADIKAEADAIRNAIKLELQERDTDELTAGRFIIRNTLVLSNRFDTTAFKRIMPELYKAYTKQVTSYRFSIT